MATHLHDLEAAALVGFSLHTTIVSDTTTKGSAVDMQLTEGPVHGIFSVANYGDANTQTVLKLQESHTTTDGDFVDITGATHTLAASATANDNSTVTITAKARSRRYVRAVAVTSGGGTVSVPVSGVIVGRKKITGTGTGTYSA